MKRLLKKESGFTLVELLVVVGIIVALAAVIIPNIARFTGSGDAAAAAAELDTLQTAMDTAMADNVLTAVVAGNAVSDISTVGGEQIDNGPDGLPDTADDIYLSPDYVRDAALGYGPYSWTTSGLVTRD